jgi:hypothetical protein
VNGETVLARCIVGSRREDTAAARDGRRDRGKGRYGYADGVANESGVGEVISFKVWLRAQRQRNDAVGDLARDVFAPVECPCNRHFKTPLGLLRHIKGKHSVTDEGVLDSVQRATVEYAEAAK